MRFSDANENLVPRVSRRSCRVVYPYIRALHKILSHFLLPARGGDMFFSETFVSFRLHISELMVLGFNKPMQLLKGKVDLL